MDDNWIDELRQKFFTANVEELDVNGAIEVKQKHIPQKLFKYREVNEFSIQNLQSSTLYCTYPSTFNDPYDSTLIFDPNFGKNHTSGLIDQLVSSGQFVPDDFKLINNANDPLKAILLIYYEKFPSHHCPTPEMVEKIADALHAVKEDGNLKIIKSFNDHIQNIYKVCSLSERIDSILMWGHYGNQHKGFAMEYNFSSLRLEELMGRFLWPVIYSEKLYDASNLLIDLGKSAPFNNMIAIIASLHKAKDWDYEKEWRIIVPDGPSFPPKNYSAPLKAIYLGSKISDSDASKLIDIAKNKNLQIFKMQLSQREFKMLPVPFIP